MTPPATAEALEAPEAAHAMSVVVDSCGFLLVRLHDEAGKIYAQASIPPATVPSLVDQVAICANASAALQASACGAVH